MLESSRSSKGPGFWDKITAWPCIWWYDANKLALLGLNLKIKIIGFAKAITAFSISVSFLKTSESFW